MRQVTIYALREVGVDRFLYVGATTNIARRRRVGYRSHAMKRALAGIAWEYVELEVTDVERSPEAEARWIAKLRTAGHRLRNVSKPSRLNARDVAPRYKSGPGGKTDLV